MKSKHITTQIALEDIMLGLKDWKLWGLLGWHDIRQRYRRSVLGPFWLSISMAIMIFSLGFLYAKLFNINMTIYLPFLTLGIITWGFISSTIQESCTAFIEAEGFIKQVKLPLSIFVYRIIWRNLIIFFHNLTIFLIVAIILQLKVGWAFFIALPGLALIIFNAIWFGILIALVSCRFRDFPQIIFSLLQPIFFVTPIIWKPELLDHRITFVYFNPFFHLVEVIRTPLLGAIPSLSTWVSLSTISLIGWITMLFVFKTYRNRIAYWV